MGARRCSGVPEKNFRSRARISVIRFSGKGTAVRALIDRFTGCAIACLAPCLALSQAPQLPMRWPTPQDIDRALNANPLPDVERLGAQPIPPPPRVNPKSDPTDIATIARGHVHLPNTGTASGSTSSAL